jgi:cytoskeletal protein CcmA (bactofilin family)
MWNRRKDEIVPRPTTAPPTASELAKEGIPMSTLSTRPVETHLDTTRGGGGPAVLGKSVIVKGQILGREDLTIDGEVEGTVELQEHRLTVGPNGKVMATVKAREVVVLGTLHGNVETRDKIQIRKDAKLVGDIRTARIEIEDGAYFKGNIDIVRTEPKPVQSTQPKPQGTAPAATAAAAVTGTSGSLPGGAVSAADNKR